MIEFNPKTFLGIAIPVHGEEKSRYPITLAVMKGARIEDVKREAAAVALVYDATVMFEFNESMYAIRPEMLTLPIVAVRGQRIRELTT